ncbi:hypothetical protein ARMA_2239 [Ardenticatena maritima]|uniref:Uncharacterized protein n=1 Tax=Ardenticatena maritima TaxID=872965 RepID=A0A0M8KAT6_9CHLR|nr:hypothetical protein ARMA_2239 [Ardenticatena maritima]
MGTLNNGLESIFKNGLFHGTKDLFVYNVLRLLYRKKWVAEKWVCTNFCGKLFKPHLDNKSATHV